MRPYAGVPLPSFFTGVRTFTCLCLPALRVQSMLLVPALPFFLLRTCIRAGWFSVPSFCLSRTATTAHYQTLPAGIIARLWDVRA